MQFLSTFTPRARLTSVFIILACATSAYAIEVAPFDFDANGHVDLADAQQILACLSGPDAPAVGGGCPLLPAYAADRDGDQDIDLRDLAAFQVCYSGDQPAILGCAAPIPPLPLLETATGQEDELLTLPLSAFDPHSSPAAVTFAITALPAHGQLAQADGTPIASAPTPVTDPNGVVTYIAAPNAFGPDYASFEYTATSLVTGLTSASRSVTIDITPVNDAPFLDLTPFQTIEDTPAMIQFIVYDPDPNDVATILVIAAPVSGTLFQVDPNGTPLLDQPIANGAFVADAQHRAYYAPAPNFWGTDSVRARAIDAAGAYTFQTPIPIYVTSVNDPPVSQDAAYDWPITGGATIRNIQPYAHDVDTLPSQLQICITSLPVGGTLKTQPAGEPITAVPYCTFTHSFQYEYADADALGFGCTPPDPNFPALFPLQAGSFTYQVFDGQDYSAEANIDLSFYYDNTPPYLTSPVNYTTIEDTPIDFTLTAADIDGDLIRFQVLAPPAHGTLLLDGAPLPYPLLLSNPTTLTYEPLPNFNTFGVAPDTWTVQTTDGRIRNCDYVFSFTVTAVNDPPVIDGPASIYTDGYAGTFNGISVADDAATGTFLTVDLRAMGPAAGAIQLLFPTGLHSLVQLTPTHIQFEGTLTAINATLAAGLTYYVAQNGATDATLEVEVNDEGNTGEGPLNPLSTLDVIPVFIPPPEFTAP